LGKTCHPQAEVSMQNVNEYEYNKAEGRKILAQAKGALFAPAGLGDNPTTMQAPKARKAMSKDIFYRNYFMNL